MALWYTVATLVLTFGSSVDSLTIPFDVSAYKDNSFEFTRVTDSGIETTGIAYARTDEDNVYIAMAAEGSFVAFGASKDTHGTMAGADIIVCEGEPIQAIEYKASGNYAPDLDTKQDWTLLQSGRANGIAYCEVTRERVSKCDLPIYDIVTGHAMLLAWSDDYSNPDVDLHYHGSNRGSVIRPFNAPPISSTNGNLENEPKYTFTLTAPPIQMTDMPGFETCSYHSLPIDPTKGYHIIGVEYILNTTVGGAAERGMSHHSTLIAFSKGIPSGHNWVDGQLLPPINGRDPIDNCHEMWGVSDQDLVPQVLYINNDEGVYFGKDRAIGVVLLRHFYNEQANPKHLTGAPDIGTKWRITYTDQLRPKTLGKFVVQTTTIDIPPQTFGYKKQVYCNGDDIKVFGSVLLTGVYLHAHDRSSDTVAMYLRHFRNGVELEPFVIDHDFVEKTSDESEYPLNVMFEAGDSILLECVYDNPTDETIVWGSGINNQMCVANFNFVSDGVAGPISCQENYEKGNFFQKAGYRQLAHGYDSSIPMLYKLYPTDQRQAILDSLVAYNTSTFDECGSSDSTLYPTSSTTTTAAVPTTQSSLTPTSSPSLEADVDDQPSAAVVVAYKMSFVFVILISCQIF